MWEGEQKGGKRGEGLWRKKSNAIPVGPRAITPYLTIKGAAKGIEFYKKAFGAKSR